MITSFRPNGSDSKSKWMRWMAFGHGQLDVYRAAIEYVGWAHRVCEGLKGDPRSTKDPFLGPSQSFPLNRAEGNGKASEADRRRFAEIERGSALECAAIQVVLEVCNGLCRKDNAEAKQILDRMVAMLTRRGKQGYTVRKSSLEYRHVDGDPDSDSNPDRE